VSPVEGEALRSLEFMVTGRAAGSPAWPTLEAAKGVLDDALGELG
jgi:hypothetical protein